MGTTNRHKQQALATRASGTNLRQVHMQCAHNAHDVAHLRATEGSMATVLGVRT
jgi:hypothetical protein